MKHISYDERQLIEKLLANKYKTREIARTMGRDHSVILREISRNKGQYLPYEAIKAHLRYQHRLKGKKQKKMNENQLLKEYVIEKIQKDWSPEQISGRLKKYEYRRIGKKISHETIYSFIYSLEGKQMKLFTHLRTKRPYRMNKHSKRKSPVIPERISIHERPKEVESRQIVGHWESDLTFGNKQKSPLSVQYERAMQLVRMHIIASKRAEENNAAIINSIDSLALHLWKTITYDNGGENVKHTEIRDDFGIQTYFCDKYCSWQKGGVENMNKLIRQYLPRYRDFSKVTEAEILEIQEKLNNRPRKNLDYLTPNEMLAKHTSGAFTT